MRPRHSAHFENIVAKVFFKICNDIDNILITNGITFSMLLVRIYKHLHDIRV